METVEEQLKQKQSEILYARKKAVDHRKRADRWDAIADAKVKEAAALGTGELPLQEQANRLMNSIDAGLQKIYSRHPPPDEPN